MNRRVWSDTECEALVSDYLNMLKAEQRGLPFNKAAHARALSPQLDGRTKGAIEDKHENVSAIAHQLGFPSINGYKPQGNYQKLLFHVAEQHFNNDRELAAILEKRVMSPVVEPAPTPIAERRVSPPKPMKGKADFVQSGRFPRKAAWLEIEARNRSLGLAGELWVIEYERDRLTRAGKPNLAERIEHVSVTIGDGLGFDVRSFDVVGTDRLIEVKTTSNPKETPFFVTDNERRLSQQNASAFYLYRVFRFLVEPQFFWLNGVLDDSCVMNPVLYSARVR